MSGDQLATDSGPLVNDVRMTTKKGARTVYATLILVEGMGEGGHEEQGEKGKEGE